MTNEEKLLITNLNDSDLIELYNKVSEHLEYLKNSLIDLDSEAPTEEASEEKPTEEKASEEDKSSEEESKTGGDSDE